MMITHVVFDLDGTLLDTESLYSTSADEVCQRYGTRYPIELKRRVMGSDTRTAARMVVEALSLPIQPEEYIAQREAALHTLLRDASPMPGALELLDALGERGIGWGIATSGHRAVTELKLTSHPALREVCTVCGDDPELARGKPAPDIFLLAAKRLGAAPLACVAVEDAVLGARAARDAGMRTVVIPDPRFGFQQCDYPEGVHFARTLMDVLDHV
jgi:HAD superfamily hydrolase (TIGR01509 family)